MKDYTFAKQRYNQIKKRNYNYLLELFVYANRFSSNIKEEIEKKFIEFSKLENSKIDIIEEYNYHLQNFRDDSKIQLEKVQEKFKELKLIQGKVGFKDFKKLIPDSDKFDKYFIDLNVFQEEIYFSNNESERRVCGYCGITEKQIHILIKEKEINTKRITTRGQTLEIDRIRPHETYVKDNILLSCYWCNNAKSDEFSLDEFKSIAFGMNLTFNNRLQKINRHETEKIKFPDYTKYKYK
jgi:hypothetical protein